MIAMIKFLNLTFSKVQSPSQVLHPLSNLAKTLIHAFLSPALRGTVFRCIVNLTCCVRTRDKDEWDSTFDFEETQHVIEEDGKTNAIPYDKQNNGEMP